MSSLDSLGFRLPPCSDAEARARAQCQAAEQSPAKIKEWTAAAAAVRALAASPASDPPKKLKALARSGVPQLLRPTLWFQLSGAQALQARKPAGYYDSLVASVCNGGAVSHRALVSRSELETYNAFPSHSLLPSIKGLSAVRRVVMAHAAHTATSLHSSAIVSVAAFLLAVMGMAKEEEAFWTLTAIRELRLHPSFYENMRGCRVEQLTLNDLTRRRCPRTAALFERAGCSLSEVTGEWVECLFVRSLPPETAARVLDVLLLEGPKTLQRVGVALFRLAEPGLLQSCKGLQVAQVLRWRIARTHNSDALLKAAYPTLPGSGISGATIEALRAEHQRTVAGERVDIVRRLTTMAAAASAPVVVPTISWDAPSSAQRPGPARHVGAEFEPPPPTDSPTRGLSGALSEEEQLEAHAEAEKALSEGGSPREALQVASLSMLLTRPQVVVQAARSL